MTRTPACCLLDCSSRAVSDYVSIDYLSPEYTLFVHYYACYLISCNSSTQHITTLLLTTHVWPPYKLTVESGYPFAGKTRFHERGRCGILARP